MTEYKNILDNNIMTILLNSIKKVGLGKISSIISNDVYNSPSKRQRTIYNYLYLPDISDAEKSVYINHSTKSIIIGVRGTSNVKDVFTDVGLVTGKLDKSTRLKELNSLIERLKNMYKGYHITTSGHSLGGGLSKKSESDLSFGFNEGTSISKQQDEKRHIGKRIKGDVVSLLSGSDTIEKDPTYNAHTIDQFGKIEKE